MGAVQVRASGRSGYRHEALVYAGTEEFLAGTVPFVVGALEAAEPVLVALPQARVDALQAALGHELATAAQFVAMEDIGRNPATIIPAWRQFLDERPPDGRSVWGIGEPIWADRTPEELAECHLHEALLNEAFVDVQGFTLLCPYDTTSLEPSTIAEAHRTHPLVRQDGGGVPSDLYAPTDVRDRRFRSRLSQPPVDAKIFPISGGNRDRNLRAQVSAHGAACGLPELRIDDLVLAANEIITNAVRHGGPGGFLALWRDGDRAVCEVRDGGTLIEGAMLGRVHPGHATGGGRGLWITNQLCDLVQIRATDEGTIVRIHVAP